MYKEKAWIIISFDSITTGFRLKIFIRYLLSQNKSCN